MKVLFLSTITRVNDTRFLRFAETLSDVGHEVMAIMPGNLAPPGAARILHYALPSIRHQFNYGSNLANVAKALLERLRNMARAKKLVRKLRPEVLVSVEPDGWILGWWARRRFKAAHVMDLQELYEGRAQAFPRPLRRIIEFAIRRLVWSSCRQAALVLHPSLARRNYYAAVPGSHQVLSLYPRPSDFPLGGQASQPASQLRLVHAGALRPTYGGSEILEAIAITRQEGVPVHLTVYGGVSSGLQNLELVRELEVAGAIHVRPHVPFRTLAGELSKYDVGLALYLPVDDGHRLAAPRKVFEYMAAGLAVLGSKTVTIESVLEESRCGVAVEPTSPMAIAAALRHLHGDRRRCRAMGERAREAVIQKYNWESQRESLIAMFARLNAHDKARG